MCNIGKFLTRALGLGDGRAEAQAEKDAADLRASTDAANTNLANLIATQNQTAAEAVALQKDALAKQTAAAVPVNDRESTRRAADERMKRLLAAGAFGAQAGKQFMGEAPIGFKMLTGT